MVLSREKIYINWLKIFQYAFVLCIILNFRSIWLHTESVVWPRLIKLLMGLSVAGGILVKRKFSVGCFSKCILAMGAMTLYVAIWYFCDLLKSKTIFVILLQLLAIIAFCQLLEESIEDTMYQFADIVLIIAVISLFFWVFGSVLGYLHPTGYLYTTWTGNDSLKRAASYYGIYFETQSETLFGLTANEIVRNTAIFTEAPMASMVFSIAFLVEWLLRDRFNWKRCMIFVVVIISTISTTGCTVLILAVGMRFMFTKARTKGFFSLKVILLPAALTLALIILIFFIRQKLGTGSGSTRVDDFAAGYRAWLDAPLFGNGYGNSDAYEQYMSEFRRDNLGISNSLTPMLAYGGIYLFLPYLFAMVYGFFNMAVRRIWHKMIFYLIFLYTFVITVCPFNMLTFYLFICMAKQGKTRRIH